MFMRTQLELSRMPLPLLHNHRQMCQRAALITGADLTADEQDYLMFLDNYIQGRETVELNRTLGYYQQDVTAVEL